MSELPALPDVGGTHGSSLPTLPVVSERAPAENVVQASQLTDDLDPGSATEPDEAEAQETEPQASTKKARASRKKSTAEPGDQTRVERVTAHGFHILGATNKLKRPGSELLKAININAVAAENVAAATESALAGNPLPLVTAGAGGGAPGADELSVRAPCQLVTTALPDLACIHPGVDVGGCASPPRLVPPPSGARYTSARPAPRRE
ncbi:hypothetical protein AURDEDRAFT_128143 [Auricularia subglabra TFB-10046 SS5]|nr:hypothetical protein AURDEDRAFT_128143 [Auricularia subglabra TFB-10046 SS5]